MALKKFLARQAYQPSGLFGSLIAGRAFNKTNGNLEDMALNQMPIRENSTILEIGFGNGRLINKIGNQLQTGKIYGIEISKPMLAQAKKLNQKLIEQGVVELQEGSIEQIPFEDHMFDVIVTHNTIYFWPDPKNNIQEVLRVLKPGGSFYCGFRQEDQMKQVTVMNQNRDIFKNLYSQERMEQFLSESGFKQVSTDHQKDKPLDNVLAVARR